MNQSNQPSEAVREAKKLSLKTFPNGSGDTHYDYLQEQRREGYETGFIEGYKYALPASIPNDGKQEPLLPHLPKQSTFTLEQTLQIADNFYNYGYSDHADSERGDSNNNPSKEEYFLKIFGIKINQ